MGDEAEIAFPHDLTIDFDGVARGSSWGLLRATHGDLLENEMVSASALCCPNSGADPNPDNRRMSATDEWPCPNRSKPRPIPPCARFRTAWAPKKPTHR